MALGFLKRLFGGKNGSGDDLLLPADHFRTLILHECARCDRNAHAFSLIHIDLQDDGADTARHRWHAVRGLSRSLVRRMRSTDEIGWLDDHTIGVFLPETGIEGAQSLARDACEGFNYRIYVYPWLTDIHDFQDGDGAGPTAAGKGSDEQDPRPYVEAAQMMQAHPQAVHAGGEGSQGSRAFRENGANIRPVVELIMPPGAPFWKRLYDICGSTVLLIALSPLFALVALYIKVVSPGPVFFRQERVGYLGRPFSIWKFRTMRVDADANVHRAHLKDLIHGDKILKKLDGETDCRWIPLAGLLRKTCLDELPQLFNVLKGEMSLIGPRPVLYYEAEEFLLWQRQRFYALPGMTGLWQVSGKNRLTFSQMMRLDARYSRKYNLLMDTAIFVKTVPAIIGQVWDSVGSRFTTNPIKKNVSVWKRTLNDLVRQVFL